ncbi:MAG: cobyrinic acid a,c-diamide synthase, partial [Gammaproteobacteria bacterium]|nr:cobyrinic acid a,c-diamide synthase [Gammaproteobacteria bacterium]
ALEDQCLPANIDGLFIGGGFPERHADRLSANQHLLTDIREKILAGLPAYAECGGLMVLCDSITWQNQKFHMASVIHADCTVHKKPQGRGYVKLQAGVNALWPDSTHQQNKIIKAHEFHYSKLDALPANAEFAYRVNRGTGIDGEHDGLIVNNLLASYTHIRHTNENPWVRNFLGFVALNRQKFTSGETRSHACHPAVNQ